MENVVTVKNLNYKNIIKNISLDVPKGAMIAISGSNKCGKTTLIKLLCGILEDNENIIFEKVYLNSLSKTDIYKKIGFVIPSVKSPFLFNSVEQELLFVLDNLGLNEEQKKERYKTIVSLFKLRPHTMKDPNKLYLFLKIKLQLALAVIHKPKLLLIDDICTKLTKEEKKEILTILKKLNEEENLTIIMTTDNLEETLDYEKLYILNKGEVILSGEPLEVLKEDSLLNKIGLSLPFMVDLSLKLKYYDLVEHIETDMERLVNTLWK